MRYKTWNVIITTFIILPMIFVAALNYFIDPFDIFHSNYFSIPYQMNERYNKIEFLNEHHHQYNGYLLGSSRIGTTDPKIFEKYLKGAKIYNLTVAGGSQFDNLQFVEYFVKHNFPIKYLFIQIDITDIYGFEPPKNNYCAQHHPSVQGISPVSFYLEQLTILPIKHISGKIKVNKKNATQHIRYDIEHSGQWFLDALEAQISRNHELYMQNEKTFHQAINREHEGKFLNKNIEALRKIKQLTDSAGIALYVFIAPHNHNMINTFHTQSYLKYLQAIAKITPFWDFSGYNSITNDNRHYYEMAHARPNLSYMIAARMFNDPYQNVPADFGQYVTSQNIDSYLQLRLAEIVLHDKNITS